MYIEYVIYIYIYCPNKVTSSGSKQIYLHTFKAMFSGGTPDRKIQENF